MRSSPVVPDPQPAEALFNELYQRLRGLARAHLRRNEPITLLDTTGLVHESYVRLAQAAPMSFVDRQHFLRSASRVMRFVVVDFIRKRHAQSRGGELMQVTLDTDLGESLTLHDAHMIRLHEALDDLERIDERLASIVEMRCYAGLGEAEIALALGVTVRTVRRQWVKARTILKAAIQ